MAAVLLFLLSGMASLILETVFRRGLVLVTGNAVTSTSLTLAAFLGGLALGALVFGRSADRTSRPLRLYGRLELAAAVASAAVVALVTVGRELLVATTLSVGGGFPGRLLEIVLAVVLVGLPATFMGGTLPALTRHVAARRANMLGALALLYGVNTLGAALGAAIAGFVLFEAVGVSRTGWIGAAIAFGAGAGALVLDRRRGAVVAPSPSVAARASKPPDNVRRGAVLASAALGGAAALGCEVLWTRLLALPLRSYAYSFSLMLSLFLVGIVLGSLGLAAIEKRVGDPLKMLAFCQVAGGMWVALTVVWMPALLVPSREGSGFLAFVAAGFTRAVPIVLPSTVLSGMALPLAARLVAAEGSHGRAIGAVYAANTLGAIGGAVLSAFVLLPWAGASGALAILGAVGAAAGTVALLAAPTAAARRALAAGVTAAAAALAFVPGGSYARVFSGPPGRGRTLYVREGVTDTVAVVRRDYGFRDAEAKSEIVNGIAMTATVKPVWRYMAAEGHLPALFAPPGSRALVICVGTGITLGALASHDDITAIDAIDLSESVLEALPIFDKENARAYRDPRVRIVHDDGRHALERSSSSYGLITLEPPPPIVAGSVHLYSSEFYGLCRKHLAPGGVVAQWMPLHAQSLASARALARTFLGAFPHVQLWLPSVRDAVLLGSERPLTLDLDRLRGAYARPRTRASLEAAYLETPTALLATYLLDRSGIERWSANADIVTDDRPSMEFFRRYGATMSDRDIASLLASPSGPIDWLRGLDHDAALSRDVEAERAAHREYVRAEIDDDARRARDAAIAARSTRFGLYRFGCDTPQLDALRSESASGDPWLRQRATCEMIFGGRL